MPRRNGNSSKLGELRSKVSSGESPSRADSNTNGIVEDGTVRKNFKSKPDDVAVTK